MHQREPVSLSTRSTQICWPGPPRIEGLTGLLVIQQTVFTPRITGPQSAVPTRIIQTITVAFLRTRTYALS